MARGRWRFACGLAAVAILHGCGEDKPDYYGDCVKYVGGMCGEWAEKCIVAHSDAAQYHSDDAFPDLTSFCESKGDKAACNEAVHTATTAACEWSISSRRHAADGHDHHAMAEQCLDGSYVAREQLIIMCVRCAKDGKHSFTDSQDNSGTGTMMMCIGDKTFEHKGPTEISALQLGPRAQHPVLSLLERNASVDVGAAALGPGGLVERLSTPAGDHAAPLSKVAGRDAEAHGQAPKAPTTQAARPASLEPAKEHVEIGVSPTGEVDKVKK